MIAFAVLHEKKQVWGDKIGQFYALLWGDQSAHIEASPAFPAVVEVLLEINFMWYWINITHYIDNLI